MSKNIRIAGTNYNNVPSIEIPLQTSGVATFYDVSDTTAEAADVATGKYFYTAQGVLTQGTSSGGGGIPIVVPQEYEQLEYIKSDGNSYIDTGMAWGTDKKIEISYCLDIGNSVQGNWHPFGNTSVFIQYGTNSNNVWVKNVYVKINENNYNTSNFALYPPFTLTVTNTNIAVKGLYSYIDTAETTIYTRSGSSVTSATKTITIFGRHKEDNSVDYKAKNMLLYRWKMYQNDTLIQELVPATRKSDNVIGLYDIVNNSFLTNGGNGNFSGGEL